MSKNDSIVYYCDDLILDRKEMSIKIDSHENKLNYNELMIIIHFMENNHPGHIKESPYLSRLARQYCY